MQFFTFEVHNIDIALNLISFPLRASHLRWAACDVDSFCASYVTEKVNIEAMVAGKVTV